MIDSNDKKNAAIKIIQAEFSSIPHHIKWRENGELLLLAGTTTVDKQHIMPPAEVKAELQMVESRYEKLRGAIQDLADSIPGDDAPKLLLVSPANLKVKHRAIQQHYISVSGSKVQALAEMIIDEAKVDFQYAATNREAIEAAKESHIEGLVRKIDRLNIRESLTDGKRPGEGERSK